MYTLVLPFFFCLYISFCYLSFHCLLVTSVKRCSPWVKFSGSWNHTSRLSFHAPLAGSHTSGYSSVIIWLYAYVQIMIATGTLT